MSIYTARMRNPELVGQLLPDFVSRDELYVGDDVRITSKEDAEIKLGDNAGVDEFRILDSDGVEVSSTDSDGNLETKGDAEITGALKKWLDGAYRTGSLPVFLEVPLTSTDWDGDAKNIGVYSIDTSAAPWNLPAGVKACLVEVRAQWAAANTNYGVQVAPKGAATGPLMVRSHIAAHIFDGLGWVPCDSNGDLDVVVMGAATAYTVLKIWGYAV